MSYDFNTVPFGVVVSGDGLIPRVGRTTNINEESIPYSNDEVIDYGGLSLRRVRSKILVLADNVDAFEAQLGVVATLNFDTVSMSARLAALDSPVMNFDRTHFWFDAYWIESY